MAHPTRSRLEAGAVLLLLDAALALVAGPLVVAFSMPQDGAFARLVYPTCFMLFLYALGLYRRETLLDTRQALARAVVAALLGSALASAVVLVVTAGHGAQGLWRAFFLCVVA